ncbi:MAG: HlyD family efflux transporter periplasmic adaptor subunit [Huintestinicola sp.]
MNENTSGRKDVIKNIAIIFLAVLLVLTFFSNTIMNYSLPQVSATYVGPGTISEQIRGSGTITAGEKYDVIFDQSRVIKSVKVKQGDTVKAGDVLFALEDTESTELTEAQDKLDTMELDYKKALLTFSAKTGYGSDQLEISDAQEELTELQEQYDLAASGNDPLGAASEEYNTLKAQSDKLTKEKDKLSLQLSSIDTEDMLDLTGDYYTRLRAAKDAVSEAETNLEKAQKEYDTVSNEISSTGDYQDEIKSKRREIDSLRATVSGLYLQIFNAEPGQDTSSYQAQIDEAEVNIKHLNQDITDLLSKSTSSLVLKTKLKDAESKKSKWEKKLSEAKETLSAETREIKLEMKEKINNNSAELDEVSEKLAAAESRKAELEAGGALSATALSAKIKEQEKKIRDLKNALDLKISTESTDIASQQLDLENQEKQIEKQKELIKKLTSESVGAEITAKVSGIVDSITVSAGETVSAGTTAASITVSDKGYSLSFSVKSEQARKVQPGDKAEITNYYWGGDMSATLVSIKADTANPQTNKILEFKITGSDLTAGQTINLAMGSKGQQYSTIVPNSAVREDSNGKFVLVMEAKSSPLGNRYKAVRCDIEVTAKDDNNSAVTGLLGSEYVITASTKPIDAGNQVRPAD